MSSQPERVSEGPALVQESLAYAFGLWKNASQTCLQAGEAEAKVLFMSCPREKTVLSC